MRQKSVKSMQHLICSYCSYLIRRESGDTAETQRHTIKIPFIYKRMRKKISRRKMKIWTLPQSSSNDKTVDPCMILISSYLTFQWHEVPSPARAWHLRVQFRQNSIKELQRGASAMWRWRAAGLYATHGYIKPGLIALRSGGVQYAVSAKYMQIQLLRHWTYLHSAGGPIAQEPCVAGADGTRLGLGELGGARASLLVSLLQHAAGAGHHPWNILRHLWLYNTKKQMKG